MKEVLLSCMLGFLIGLIIPALIGVWGALEKKKEPPTQVIQVTGDWRTIGKAIMRYASRAEQRSVGRQIGADIELILPADFSRDKLEYDAAQNYDYIVENGPSQGVTVRIGGQNDKR